jgi:DNA-binding Lrp family transcriptional regulator
MTLTALDRIDFEIIRLLSNDARLANKELAAATGLAQSTCHERLKRLYKMGILQSTHLEVDLKAIGLPLEALLFIELARQQRDAVDRLLREIQLIPEVRRAFVISGRYDLAVYVAVRDTDHLRALEYERFTNQALVSRVETSIIFESRVRHELPLPDHGAFRRTSRRRRAKYRAAKP